MHPKSKLFFTLIPFLCCFISIDIFDSQIRKLAVEANSQIPKSPQHKSELEIFELIKKQKKANNKSGAKPTKKRHLKVCSINVLMQCVEQIFQYTHKPNGTGFLETEQEFDDFCFKYHDFTPYCIKKFFLKCSAPYQQDLVEKLVLVPYRQSIKEFCKKGGEMRKIHLQYSKCAIYQVKTTPEYRRTCIRDLQAGIEYIHEHYTSDRSKLLSLIRGSCCVYNRWESCIRARLNHKCGPESEQTIVDFIHQPTMRLVSTFCPMNSFGPGSDKCTGLVPENFETPPKGFKSKAIGSHLFSYFCPNAGYGLLEENDI